MKEKTFTYTLTLPLSTERFQEDILDKRLEIARNIYNSVLGNAMKRYNLMIESKEYRSLKKQLNNSNKLYHECEVIKVKNKLNKNRKELYKQIQSINLKYGLSQYSLYEDVKLMYKHFKDNIGSLEAQAKRLRDTADKWQYGFDNIKIGIKIKDLRDGKTMKVTNLKNGSNDFEAYEVNNPKCVGRGYHYIVSNWEILN